MVPVSTPLLWIVFDNSLDADTWPAFIDAAGLWNEMGGRKGAADARGQWIASAARA
jgi:hypothetical protein